MYTTGGYGGFAGGLPKAVKYLMIANIAVFVVMLIFPYQFWNYLFGLVPSLVSRGFVWQFVTYMFIHGGFMHILFNMFALWMFGTELEYNWGTRDFLLFYFVCGIGGGLLVWLTALAGLSSMNVATIGASGAIFGLLVAFGMMWPDRLIFLFGILPIKALHFVLIFGALDLLQGLSGAGGNIAYFAHVGGGVTGFLYLKFGWRLTAHIASWWNHFISRFKRKSARFRVYEGGLSDTERGREESDYEPPHPDRDEEIDRILDKIAREGMNSLSAREHKILETASKRKRR